MEVRCSGSGCQVPGREELMFVLGKQEAMGMWEDFGGRAKVSVGWTVESRICSSKGKGKHTFPGEINNLGWISPRETQGQMLLTCLSPWLQLAAFLPSWTNCREEDSSWDALVPF